MVYGRIEVEHIEATFDSLIGELRNFFRRHMLKIGLYAQYRIAFKMSCT